MAVYDRNEGPRDVRVGRETGFEDSWIKPLFPALVVEASQKKMPDSFYTLLRMGAKRGSSLWSKNSMRVAQNISKQSKNYLHLVLKNVMPLCC
jgi:hypothetical protein